MKFEQEKNEYHAMSTRRRQLKHVHRHFNCIYKGSIPDGYTENKLVARLILSVKKTPESSAFHRYHNFIASCNSCSKFPDLVHNQCAVWAFVEDHEISIHACLEAALSVHDTFPKHFRGCARDTAKCLGH